MTDDRRLNRLRFRAWHRGTKEADLMLGGFVDLAAASLGEADIAWLERLLEESDADILAWITGKASVPAAYDTPLMTRMRRLDYIPGAPQGAERQE
ncbi:MAG: succinate dehydrogenase assembly factor 2 [Alphaproteobacteria bacterium]|nr:MAG: succinate dehydrogenase assembly factor 2 [Alphaproteobacteria bacterium]